MTPEQLRILFDGYPPPEPAPKRPNKEQLSALFAPIESFDSPITKATTSTAKKATPLKTKRETPTQKAKREVMTAVQKARRNIKLLEYADKLAISKIKAPQNQKYKNVLRKQEEQLHHYLKQYADPNYLPKAITKEYEFPKYFYYTVNSKKGIAHKRTRTDSAMFAKFMTNPEKKQQAELQGLFNKPLSIKTKKPAPASMPSPVKTVEKKKPSLEIMPFEGEELIEDMPSHTPTKKNINIQRRLFLDEEDDLLSEKEMRELLSSQRRDPINEYVKSNWKKFRRLLESVGQMPPYYDNLSDFKKDEFARSLARDFYKTFILVNKDKKIDPSDYKKLKSFGTRNNLIYRPTDTTKQEKELKLESEKEFMTIMLKTNPALDLIPFVGEELIESTPSYAPIKKNITLRKKEKVPLIDDVELALLEEYIEEAEQEAKLAKADAKKAQEHAKDATEKVKILKTAMGDSGAPLIFKKIPLGMPSKNAPATPSKGKILRMITNAKGEEVPLMEWEEDKKPLIGLINNPNIIRQKARVYDSDDDAAATRALERYFNLDAEKASAPKKKK